MIAILLAATLAVIMLVWVNRIVRRNGKPTGGAVAVCLLFTAFPWFCILYSLPLSAQGALLAFALPLASIPRRGPTVYRYTSFVVAIVLWGLAAGNTGWAERQYSMWRDENPFESLEGRVPEPKPMDGGAKFDDDRLKDLEDKLPERWVYPVNRTASLRTLHVHRVGLFLRAAGFGSARMMVVAPNPAHFAPEFVPSIPQADEYVPDLVSLGDETPADRLSMFGKMHTGAVLDFVNPDGWGYVKDRTQVAGFRSHRFGRSPEMIDRWAVTRVDLIGLLKHDKPAVYVSELLPRMDQLKDTATREVDSFEAEGLRAVRKGDDLFARGTDTAARMVGAIRSVTQCVECHGGQRGDLLGAFSYRLTTREVAK
jgi:hypothetical protein